MSRYDDILDLPYEGVKQHRRMSAEARAAQFAPFAALTGYEDSIAEQGRLTETRLELSADEQAELSSRLTRLLSLQERPCVTFVYFQPDATKEGGRYLTAKGIIKTLDEQNHRLVLTHGTVIPLSNLTKIIMD